MNESKIECDESLANKSVFDINCSIEQRRDFSFQIGLDHSLICSNDVSKLTHQTSNLSLMKSKTIDNSLLETELDLNVLQMPQINDLTIVDNDLTLTDESSLQKTSIAQKKDFDLKHLVKKIFESEKKHNDSYMGPVIKAVKKKK